MVQENMEFGEIREPIVDGIFYPDEASALEDCVRDLLQKSETPAGMASAIAAPHGGYEYCGSIMASAFKSCAAREIRRVVIIGPLHRDPDEALFLPESGWFRTPLGLVPVHTDLIRAFEACSSLFVRNDIPHLEEHCIEVQLPFVQFLFPRASIVPILVGKSTPALAEALGNALRQTLASPANRDLLIVLTLNLTNYLDRSVSQREAGKLVDLILSRNGDEIMRTYGLGELSTCGAAVLAAYFTYAGSGVHVEISERGASNSTNRDRSNTVEYASIGFS